MEQRKNYTGYGQRSNNYSNQNREQEIHKIEGLTSNLVTLL